MIKIQQITSQLLTKHITLPLYYRMFLFFLIYFLLITIHNLNSEISWCMVNEEESSSIETNFPNTSSFNISPERMPAYINFLETRYSEVKNEVRELHNAYGQLRQQHDNLQYFYNHLEEEIHVLNATNTELKNILTTQEIVKNTVESRCKSLEYHNNILMERIEQLRKAQSDLQRTPSQLEQQIKSLRSINEDLRFGNEINKTSKMLLEHRCDVLENQNKALSLDIAELKRQNENLQDTRNFMVLKKHKG